jgi:hypothetical protein
VFATSLLASAYSGQSVFPSSSKYLFHLIVLLGYEPSLNICDRRCLLRQNSSISYLIPNSYLIGGYISGFATGLWVIVWDFCLRFWAPTSFCLFPLHLFSIIIHFRDPAVRKIFALPGTDIIFTDTVLGPCWLSAIKHKTRQTTIEGDLHLWTSALLNYCPSSGNVCVYDSAYSSLVLSILPNHSSARQLIILYCRLSYIYRAESRSLTFWECSRIEVCTSALTGLRKIQRTSDCSGLFLFLYSWIHDLFLVSEFTNLSLFCLHIVSLSLL